MITTNLILAAQTGSGNYTDAIIGVAFFVYLGWLVHCQTRR